MIDFYQFEAVRSEEFAVDFGKQFQQWERTRCDLNPKHDANMRRIGELHHFVRHNNRGEKVIAGMEWAVHQDVIEQFEREGFTGYRTKPAKVTFQDGGTSDEYREFIITGWAGVAQPESGMRVLASCPACKWKNYGPIADFDRVIDWSQWSGEDFFMVWPLVGHPLCTERVADWVRQSGIRNLRAGRGFEFLKQKERVLHYGIPRGPLSDYFPEDLAIKYGRPLGLE